MALAGVEFAVIRELEATSDEYGVMQGLNAWFQIHSEGNFEIFWVSWIYNAPNASLGESYPVSSESLVEWEPVY